MNIFLIVYLETGFSFPQVIPKAEILRLGVLEQSKEEVIVQVGDRTGVRTSPFGVSAFPSISVMSFSSGK